MNFQRVIYLMRATKTKLTRKRISETILMRIMFTLSITHMSRVEKKIERLSQDLFVSTVPLRYNLFDRFRINFYRELVASVSRSNFWFVSYLYPNIPNPIEINVIGGCVLSNFVILTTLSGF